MYVSESAFVPASLYPSPLKTILSLFHHSPVSFNSYAPKWQIMQNCQTLVLAVDSLEGSWIICRSEATVLWVDGSCIWLQCPALQLLYRLLCLCLEARMTELWWECSAPSKGLCLKGFREEGLLISCDPKCALVPVLEGTEVPWLQCLYQIGGHPRIPK